MCSPIRVWCFYCYNPFEKQEATIKCDICSDYKCPNCTACLCMLTPGEQRVALAMMRTYEPLLGNEYDFSVHAKVEENFR